jgi:hypothetical protein
MQLPDPDYSSLDTNRTEFLGFPNGRHDDQVDSTTQFLKWARASGYGSRVDAQGVRNSRSNREAPQSSLQGGLRRLPPWPPTWSRQAGTSFIDRTLFTALGTPPHGQTSRPTRRLTPADQPNPANRPTQLDPAPSSRRSIRPILVV